MTLVWLRMLRMITMNQVDTPANKDNNMIIIVVALCHYHHGHHHL